VRLTQGANRRTALGRANQHCFPAGRALLEPRQQTRFVTWMVQRGLVHNNFIWFRRTDKRQTRLLSKKTQMDGRPYRGGLRVERKSTVHTDSATPAPPLHHGHGQGRARKACSVMDVQQAVKYVAVVLLIPLPIQLAVGVSDLLESGGNAAAARRSAWRCRRWCAAKSERRRAGAKAESRAGPLGCEVRRILRQRVWSRRTRFYRISFTASSYDPGSADREIF
jgi:hypothetical protein